MNADEYFARYFSEDNAKRSDPIKLYPWQKDVINTFFGHPIIKSPFVPKDQLFLISPSDLGRAVAVMYGDTEPAQPPTRRQRLKAWLKPRLYARRGFGYSTVRVGRLRVRTGKGYLGFEWSRP